MYSNCNDIGPYSTSASYSGPGRNTLTLVFLVEVQNDSENSQTSEFLIQIENVKHSLGSFKNSKIKYKKNSNQYVVKGKGSHSSALKPDIKHIFS